MIKAKVGDKVSVLDEMGSLMVERYTVTKITDESIVTKKNGDIVKTKKIKVIWCSNQAFNAKNGNPLNPPYDRALYYRGGPYMGAYEKIRSTRH